MGEIMKVDRCIYCFAPFSEEQQEEKKKDHRAERRTCPVCGYEDGLCMLNIRWLLPGTILKGTYMTGKLLENRESELIYLGWNLKQEQLVEIHEYFPEAWLERDVTASDQVNCRPGREEAFESGRQEFFERAKTYYQCISRVKDVFMDFFVRNGTCYYVRERK